MRDALRGGSRVQSKPVVVLGIAAIALVEVPA
jgi:hypothetical protein